MNQATAVGQKWFNLVQKGDGEAIRELIADDVDFMTPAGQLGNPQDVADFAMGYHTGFPDAKFRVERWIEEEDVSVAEAVYTGTHTGTLGTPMGDVAPTGRSVTIPFVSIFGEREGQIAFSHHYWDNAGFMTQLGLMPEPGQA